MTELTKTEALILDTLKLGLSNKEIGQRLFICEKTVKFHLSNIFKKIGVKSKLEFLALELQKMRAPKVEESGLTPTAESGLTLPHGGAQR